MLELYKYILKEAGPQTAGGYVDRIETACMGLGTFPNRGAKRDDIRPGLRIVGFEKRAVIAFVVKQKEVLIARILYGGRDYESLLRMSTDDKEP